MPGISFRFRPHEHLRRPVDFRRVYDRRRSARDGCLTVCVCENGLEYSRLGRSVSRKAGNAVVRNRLRRLYREAFRLSRHELPTGLDIVMLPVPSSEPSLAALQASLVKLVGQVARKLRQEARPT